MQIGRREVKGRVNAIELTNRYELNEKRVNYDTITLESVLSETYLHDGNLIFAEASVGCRVFDGLGSGYPVWICDTADSNSVEQCQQKDVTGRFACGIGA